MKIAILGTRGIPASYSGFETAVEEIASRLTERGHELVVYCRPHVVDPKLRRYKGAELVHLALFQVAVEPLKASQGLLQTGLLIIHIIGGGQLMQ